MTAQSSIQQPFAAFATQRLHPRLPQELQDIIFGFVVGNDGQPYTPLPKCTVDAAIKDYQTRSKSSDEHGQPEDLNRNPGWWETRIQNPRWLPALGLLLSCRAFYHQAVIPLYAKSTCRFSDTRYGTIDIQVSVIKHCVWCRTYDATLRRGGDATYFRNQCWVRGTGNKHDISAPQSSITSASRWITQIGIANAKRITRLELAFHSNIFLRPYQYLSPWQRHEEPLDYCFHNQILIDTLLRLACCTSTKRLDLKFEGPRAHCKYEPGGPKPGALLDAFWDLFVRDDSINSRFEEFELLEEFTMNDENEALTLEPDKCWEVDPEDERGVRETWEFECRIRALHAFELLREEILESNKARNLLVEDDSSGSEEENAEPETGREGGIGLEGGIEELCDEVEDASPGSVNGGHHAPEATGDLKAGLDVDRANEIGEALKKLRLEE